MESLYKPKTAVAISLIIMLIVFLEPIRNQFDKLIVTPFLEKVTSTGLNDGLFLLLFLLVTWVIFNTFKKRQSISIEISVLAIVILGLYALVRFKTGDYLLSPFQTYAVIKYCDILLLIGFGIIFIKCYALLERNKEPNYMSDPFLLDMPITRKSQDLLNRQKFATRIAQKIQSKPVGNSGALAIGITGEWGSGKTSFSNLIESSINKENRILIKFNPWRSSSSEKIIEDFFSLLIAELEPYDQNLSKNVYSYAKTLTEIDENIFTKTVQYFADFFDTTNKNEIYESINNSIRQIKKQIIIFIDDLDRLDKKEIAEVLRIIRNTANFNQVVYVVAYDKEYVLEGIKSFNESNHQAFLEKIFQFEFALPLYRAEVIRTYLKKLLETGLPENYRSQLNTVLESRAYRGINFTSEIVETHRAAIRLANALLFEIKEIIDDVFLYDFYLLQLLKMKFPKVFVQLFENYNLYFVPVDRGREVYHRLRKEHERNSDPNQLDVARFMRFAGNDFGNEDKLTDEQKTPVFFNDLKKMKLPDSDILIIEGLLTELLDQEREISNLYKNERYKVFAKANNFYKYFAFELLDGEIPAIEFELARRKDYAAYREEVLSWSKEDKLGALIDRLTKIEIFENILEFENHIKILFEIGRGYTTQGNIHGFDRMYLFEVLSYPIKNKEKKLSLYETQEQFYSFLISNFQDDPETRSFENLMIAFIMSQEGDFPIANEKLSEISLANFIRYTRKYDELSSEFWDLYHSCKIIKEGHYRPVANPAAQPYMREFYKNHLFAKDLGKFIMQTSPESEYYYIDKERWKGVFDTIEEFEEWLSNADHLDRESDNFIEFKEFYDKSIPALPNGIKYQFSHITPDRWR